MGRFGRGAIVDVLLAPEPYRRVPVEARAEGDQLAEAVLRAQEQFAVLLQAAEGGVSVR